MKDQEIVDLFWCRSERANKENQTKYQRYCDYISGNILSNREDIEECVNEVLATAWYSILPQKPANMRTYLGKLTRRISISRYRENHAGSRAPCEFSESLEEIEEIAVDEDFDK